MNSQTHPSSQNPQPPPNHEPPQETQPPQANDPPSEGSERRPPPPARPKPVSHKTKKAQKGKKKANNKPKRKVDHYHLSKTQVLKGAEGTKAALETHIAVTSTHHSTNSSKILQNCLPRLLNLGNTQLQKKLQDTKCLSRQITKVEDDVLKIVALSLGHFHLDQWCPDLSEDASSDYNKIHRVSLLHSAARSALNIEDKRAITIVSVLSGQSSLFATVALPAGMTRFFTVVLPLLVAFSTVAVDGLDNAINTFSPTGGTLTQALAVNALVQTLVATIDKGTLDANATPTPSDETDSQIILNSILALVDPITTALNDAVARKAVVQALPFTFGAPLLVRTALGSLASSATAFENALIAEAPADMKAQAQQLADQINAQIAAAQAAYANV
ncbi:hypothetical protein L218DRAFT_1009887 [Marasmius fiardii PR-910]|nr:hypothetical protein L218DRAFT_1009887 [Marasmius fiardii PR-910]